MSAFSANKSKIQVHQHESTLKLSLKTLEKYYLRCSQCSRNYFRIVKGTQNNLHEKQAPTAYPADRTMRIRNDRKEQRAKPTAKPRVGK